jgi:hypothetical protein
MTHFKPIVNPADPNEPVIDLESSGIIDLEHARVCGGTAENSATPQPIEVVEPQSNRRCANSDREILRMPFTQI